MAVLTAITEADAQALLVAYGRGRLRAMEGIPAGSVNSNFSLEVDSERFFLRIYEEQDREGAGRETAMLGRLGRAGVSTPAPLRRTDGGLVSVVRGKPAALFPWREGSIRCQAAVTPEDTALVGEALARVHLAGASEICEPGRYRFEDLQVRLDRIATSGDSSFVTLVPTLRAALERAQAARRPELPSGMIHGDLFRDNVLWNARGQVEALLDFEMSCAGTYAYDLMVTVLAWCVGDDLDGRLASALRAGYERVRPLAEAERGGLATEGCFVALRFAITRITDFALRGGAAGPRVSKDWRRFMMRFDKLQALGSEGVRALLGV
jgi:homoserine kinase type II